jgi:hypothetical protein
LSGARRRDATEIRASCHLCRLSSRRGGWGTHPTNARPRTWQKVTSRPSTQKAPAGTPPPGRGSLPCPISSPADQAEPSRPRVPDDLAITGQKDVLAPKRRPLPGEALPGQGRVAGSQHRRPRIAGRPLAVLSRAARRHDGEPGAVLPGTARSTLEGHPPGLPLTSHGFLTGLSRRGLYLSRRGMAGDPHRPAEGPRECTRSPGGFSIRRRLTTAGERGTVGAASGGVESPRVSKVAPQVSSTP